jgi:DNA-binding MarR family transcriptional regulator
MPAQQSRGEESYDFSRQIGHLLRKAYHRHLAIFQDNACDPRMTSVQFATLCALRDHGASTQVELIRATGIDQATIRGIIDRLAARGFVSFLEDPNDGRKVIIDLTPAGAGAVAAMIPCAIVATEMTFGDLDAVERVALTQVLRKMIAAPTNPSE